MTTKEKETDLKAKIAYIDSQIIQKQLWAQYWTALASSGAAARAKTKQGRDPTPEEKAQGQVIGWRDLTDAEKIDNAFETALTHIDHIGELAGARDKLIRELGRL